MIEGKGQGATIRFDGETVTIERSASDAVLYHHGVRTTRFHIRNIAAVEFKAPNLSGGWITLLAQPAAATKGDPAR